MFHEAKSIDFPEGIVSLGVQGVEVDECCVFSYYNDYDGMNSHLCEAGFSKKLFLDTCVMRLRSSPLRLAVSTSTSSALR